MPIENQDLLRPLSTPQQINQRHREFWREQWQLMTKRFSDAAIRELANEDMQSEAAREVPLRSRKSFEQALADAEWRRNFARRDLSRKGGMAPKHDALQDLIKKIFCACPNITARELLHELKRRSGQGVITSIDAANQTRAGEGPLIHYEDEDGTPRTASVSGLTDRLSSPEFSGTGGTCREREVGINYAPHEQAKIRLRR